MHATFCDANKASTEEKELGSGVCMKLTILYAGQVMVCLINYLYIHPPLHT